MSRLLASRNVSEAGSRTSGGSSRPAGDRSAHGRPAFPAVSCRRARRRFGPELGANRVEQISDVLVGRVQFGSHLQLDERLVEPRRRHRVVRASRVVLLGGAEFGALEALPGGAVVGILFEGPGVFDDRPVVVLGESRRARRYAARTSRRRPRRQASGERRGRRRLIGCAISDDVDAARDAEDKLLIGYSRVFLQVRECQGGIAALAVPGRQCTDLQGRRIDRDDQVFVFRFAAAASA